MTVQRLLIIASAATFMLGVGMAGPASAGDEGKLKTGAISQFATIGGAAKLMQGGLSAVQGVNVVRGSSIDVSGSISQHATVGGELTMDNYGASVTQGVNVVQAGDPAADTISSMMPIRDIIKGVGDVAGMLRGGRAAGNAANAAN
jgi:hypothetical protein